MKRTLTKILIVFLFIGALSLTLSTRVEKANAEVAAGNRAFAAQNYDIALQHYTKAQAQSIGEGNRSITRPACITASRPWTWPSSHWNRL